MESKRVFSWLTYPPPSTAAGELLLRNAAFRPAQKAQEQERRLMESSALEQVGKFRWLVGWLVIKPSKKP